MQQKSLFAGVDTSKDPKNRPIRRFKDFADSKGWGHTPYDVAEPEDTTTRPAIKTGHPLEQLPDPTVKTSGFSKWQDQRNAVIRVLLQWIMRDQGSANFDKFSAATRVVMNPRLHSDKVADAQSYLDSVHYAAAHTISNDLMDDTSSAYEHTLLTLWEIFKDLFPHDNDKNHFYQIIKQIKNIAKGSNVISIRDK